MTTPNDAAGTTTPNPDTGAAGGTPSGSPPEINISAPEVVVPTVDTGDAALDLAFNFFAKAGVSQDHPALKHATTTGDFALIEATLKEKGESAKGYEPYLKIAKQQYEKNASEQKAAAAASKKMVFDAVGGEAKWATIREWAIKNATPEEAAAVNAGLTAGGEQARITAKYLAAAFVKATARDPKEGAEALKQGAVRSAPAASKALSPADYQRAVAQLSAKIGTQNMEHSPELAQLRAARRAWRG